MTDRRGLAGRVAAAFIDSRLTQLVVLAALLVALLAVFVAWDLVFCGGRRCRRFTDSGPGQP